MFTSRKILYFIILSLLIVCAINGIDYRSNSYSVVEENNGTLMDFSDSGFFAVSSQDGDVSIVSKLDTEDGTDSSSDSSDSPDYPDSPDASPSPDGSGDISIDNNPDDNTPENDAPDANTTAADNGAAATTNGINKPENTTAVPTTANSINKPENTTQQAVLTTEAQPEMTTAATEAYSQPVLTTAQPEDTTQPAQQPQLTTNAAEPATQAPQPALTTAAPTTTTTTTTTTTEFYSDSGSIHFAYSEVMIYAGANTTVEVSFPIGSQKLASFSSKDTSIASVRNYDDVTALITGENVGSTWIQAANASGDVAYCHVIVTDFAHEVIRLTNIERNNNGLPSLAEGIPLVQQVADLRLSESSTMFSHTRPNGKKFSTAAQDLGLSYNHIGENLACGQTTPQQVVQEWMASPTHRANILSPNYTTLCVSYGIGADGMPYWVQIFHTP